MKKTVTGLFIITAAAMLFAQSEDAYSTPGSSEGGNQGGLLDPSRFSINHAVSFGAAGTSTANIKSQSLYSTMMQYKFTAPVTLNLNFSLPIHSTFSSTQNLTTDNIESLAYFKNMPWDVSLSWKPTEKMMMRFTVAHQPYQPYYSRGMYPMEYDMFGDRIQTP